MGSLHRRKAGERPVLGGGVPCRWLSAGACEPKRREQRRAHTTGQL